jgi:hypothetical protein
MSLIKYRDIATISIDSADSFFVLLEHKVEALELVGRKHPLSIAIAIASMKRFMAEDRYRIDLRELVMEEVEIQMRALDPLPLPIAKTNPEVMREFDLTMQLYESRMEMLSALVSYGAYYGTSKQAVLWSEAILRTLQLATSQGGIKALLDLRHYPACILVYAAGVAAVASKNYHVLRVLREAKTRRPVSLLTTEVDLIFNVVPGQVVDPVALTGRSRWSLGPAETPVSDRLHGVLRKLLAKLIPSDADFDDAFDRFEYLFTLIHFDLKSAKGSTFPSWAPVGRFVWRGRGFGADGVHVSETLAAENEAERGDWLPIREGLFASFDRFKLVNDTYRETILGKIQVS